MIQYEAKKEIQKILEKPKEESNNISFNISNYLFLFLGIPSNSSAFCSFITKESDETKANTTINPSINLNFIRLSSSSPKLASRKINLCFLDIKNKTQNKTPNKLFKLNLYTKDKTKKKETKEKENINKKNNITTLNNIPPHKEIKSCNNVDNSINNKTNKKTLEANAINKNKKAVLDSYSQNYNLLCMKKNPPKLPEVFYHKHNFKSSEIVVGTNSSYAQLNRGTIPNIFFGHLMVESNKFKIGFGGKKLKHYIRSSATQRNNKKLLTVIYYSPV